MIIRNGRHSVTALVLFILTVSASGAAAFEKWAAEKKYEITGAGNISFNQPSDLVVFDGTIYVLDSMNNRICLFNSRAKHTGTIRGTAAAPLTGAMGLTKDGRGGFYVADGYRGKVLTFSGDRKLKVFINILKGEEEQPPDPTGLLYFNDRLYLADNDNHLLRVFSGKGEPEGQWGGLGEGYGLFKYPFRVAADVKGRIVVSDVLNSRLQLFTPRGEFLGSLGGSGVVSGTLFRPGGFDIDEKGLVYIADNYFGNVQVFDVSGRLAAIIYGSDGKMLELENPVSLRFVEERMFVVEMGADRVSVFSLQR